MKKFIIISVLCLLGFSVKAGESAGADEKVKVYVVMSDKAYAYHRTRECSAVRRSKHPVKEVSLEEALEMNRKKCRLCYD